MWPVLRLYIWTLLVRFVYKLAVIKGTVDMPQIGSNYGDSCRFNNIPKLEQHSQEKLKVAPSTLTKSTRAAQPNWPDSVLTRESFDQKRSQSHVSMKNNNYHEVCHDPSKTWHQTWNMLGWRHRHYNFRSKTQLFRPIVWNFLFFYG